jgi:sigma-E factor negative regulatory protein RseC
MRIEACDNPEVIRIKTEEGIVIETDGVTAQVKAGRHVECKDCGACPGSEAAVVTVRNQINALVGQRVAFEVKDTGALKGAFLIFIFPLLALFLGVLLGGLAAGFLAVNLLLGRVLGAVILFAVSLVSIMLYDRRVSKGKDALPAIIHIIK